MTKIPCHDTSEEQYYHDNPYYHDIDLASYYNSTMAVKLNDERNSVAIT